MLDNQHRVRVARSPINCFAAIPGQFDGVRFRTDRRSSCFHSTIGWSHRSCPGSPALGHRRNSELRGDFRRKSFLSLYFRVAATCQARAPAGSQVRSITVGSMDSTSHPSEKEV